MCTTGLRRRPRLPVPPLEATVERYLESIEPFIAHIAAAEQCTEQDARAKRRSWADDFVKSGGLGLKLQERLKGTYYLRSFGAMQHNRPDQT